MPPTTPKTTTVLTDLLADMTRQRDEAQTDAEQWRKEVSEVRAERLADAEAEMISKAIRALTDPNRGRYGPGSFHPDYERILRYLAQRFDVRWPSQPGEALGLIEVPVFGNILDGTMLTIDPAARAIVDSQPPRFG